MEKYYRVLGVSRGAGQNEIKKAYFKLIRQYSPEKNPEQFREIREAYECLKNVQEEVGPSFPQPKDSWAQQYLEQIKKYEKIGNFSMLRDLCQEAQRFFSEEIQFEYLLAVAQRKAGNTGKAIKTCENLIQKDSENKWYWRELAFSYIERGYSKKAIPAIKKAFSLGCSDNDFILTSSVICNEQKERKFSIEILLSLVKKEKRWSREEIPDVMEAFAGLLICQKTERMDLREVFVIFEEFLEQYSLYLEENADMLVQILLLIMYLSDNDLYKKHLENICRMMENSHSDKLKEAVSELRKSAMFRRVEEDDRFSEIIIRGIYLYYIDDLEGEFRTFASLDLKLCMLKEREEILSQLDILEKEYPVFFDGEFREFAEKLRLGTNLENMKAAFQQQYAPLTQYIDGGRYFECYPEEMTRSFGKVIYQSDDYIPYVREERKIGRNNSCPCGSGKKYKHCCMNKKN